MAPVRSVHQRLFSEPALRTLHLSAGHRIGVMRRRYDRHGPAAAPLYVVLRETLTAVST
jgi:hypothetical protein